jgi:hypothetical protein
VAEIAVAGHEAPPPADPAGLQAQGAGLWPLALARELDDLFLHIRTNEEELGRQGRAVPRPRRLNRRPRVAGLPQWRPGRPE